MGDRGEKFTTEQAQEYWRGVHRATHDDLAAVCFPGKSRLLNRFFNAIECYALDRALRACVGAVRDLRVADLGCGRGRWLGFYKALGAEPVGIDLSADAVMACQSRGFEVAEGSIAELPWPDASFDLAQSITVLLHLPPELQVAAASEMSRVTRAGGYVVLLESTWSDPSPHVWSRTVEEWLALFPDFEPVWIESHYFVQPLLGLWRSRMTALPQRLFRLLEDCTVLLCWPLEFVQMAIHRNSMDGKGLQHLMVLKKKSA